MAAPSEVVGKVNVLSKKKTALNKSEIMEPNKSKFNKCDFFFFKFAIYVRGQSLWFFAPGFKKPCYITAHSCGFSY